MKKILVGVDSSPRSSEVIAAAVRLAQLSGAKLHLFRGVGVPRDVPAIAWSVAPGELDAVLESGAANPSSRNLMAVALVRIGDYDEALRLYEQLTPDFPDHPARGSPRTKIGSGASQPAPPRVSRNSRVNSCSEAAT